MAKPTPHPRPDYNAPEYKEFRTWCNQKNSAVIGIVKVLRDNQITLNRIDDIFEEVKDVINKNTVPYAPD